MSVTERFSTSYMDKAVFNLPGLLDEAVRTLGPISGEFDTLVGTGFSGGIVIPTLALRMEKNWVLIRKEDDDSHHGGGRLVGMVGERWIFVDDFISSGRTFDRVTEKINNAVVTTFVGQYLYYDGIFTRPVALTCDCCCTPSV